MDQVIQSADCVFQGPSWFFCHLYLTLFLMCDHIFMHLCIEDCEHRC